MDNRTDVTEDQQVTPEHGASTVKDAGGLTAGPHNNPPGTRGIEDTYRAPEARAPEAAPGRTQRWARLQAVARDPVSLALSVLGVALVLLVVRGIRSR